MKYQKILGFILFIICIFYIIFSLSKRNDYTEISENAYVSSMGISFENNEFAVYLYVLNNFNINKSDYGSQFSKNLGYVSIGHGSSIPDALALINKFSNIRLQYSHIRTLILHQNFFNYVNLEALLEHIKLSPDFYPTFLVYTTSDDLLSIYNVQNFSETSGYYTLLTNSNGLNKPKDTTFLDFINDFLTSTHTSIFPHLKTSEEIFYEDEKPFRSVDVTGYSVINKDYKLDFFTFKEFPGLKFLNRLSKNVITFPDFDFLIYEYNMKKKYHKDKLYLEIFLRGEFVRGKNSKVLYKKLEDAITKDLIFLKQKMDEANIDIFEVNSLSFKNNFLNTKIAISYKII